VLLFSVAGTTGQWVTTQLFLYASVVQHLGVSAVWPQGVRVVSSVRHAITLSNGQVIDEASGLWMLPIGALFLLVTVSLFLGLLRLMPPSRSVADDASSREFQAGVFWAVPLALVMFFSMSMAPKIMVAAVTLGMAWCLDLKDRRVKAGRAERSEHQ
jgi:hypothetical protein